MLLQVYWKQLNQQFGSPQRQERGNIKYGMWAWERENRGQKCRKSMLKCKNCKWGASSCDKIRWKKKHCNEVFCINALQRQVFALRDLIKRHMIDFQIVSCKTGYSFIFIRRFSSRDASFHLKRRDSSILHFYNSSLSNK